jgi:hypothetical protein
MPSLASAVPSMILDATRCCLAAPARTAAKAAGVWSAGGVLTQSRAWLTAAPTISAVANACMAALLRARSVTITTSAGDECVSCDL